MLPRWVHRLYAWTSGYFWLPCPICGEMFGGHEAGQASIKSNGHNLVICYDRGCHFSAGYMAAIDGLPLTTEKRVLL